MIYQVGHDLLMREVDGTKYRLLGIGITDFSDPNLPDLYDLVDGAEIQQRAEIERAIDTVRDKFGFEAIGKGRGYPKQPASKQPT